MLASLDSKAIVSHSEGETQDIGAELGKLLDAGDLICLEGELGSGKTSFVQGIGRGLGIDRAIHSPTFILANEHAGDRLRLYHLDVYRVGGPQEALGFGLADYVEGDGVCVIEWAEKVAAVLPAERLWVTFRDLGESERELIFRATGRRYSELLGNLVVRLTESDHAVSH